MKIGRALLLPSLALALGMLTVGPVNADMQVTEKTTTYKGTVTEVNPTSSTIILRSETSALPTTYTFSKDTVFVDETGKTVSYEVLRNSPVTVQYTRDGDRMIVTKVRREPTTVRKETTTTTTTTN